MKRQLLPGVLSYGQDFTELFVGDAGDLHRIPGTSGKSLIFVDRGVVRNSAATALMNRIRQTASEPLVRIDLDGGEAAKSISVVADLEAQAGNLRFQHVVAIGGGAVINVATYFSGTRPWPHRLVLVPTTTMAMTDVAVGGLGLLNAADGGKNRLRVVRDPNRICCLCDFLEGGPALVRRDGMAEVLKHALFQDRDLIEPALDAFLDEDLSPGRAFDLAVAGLDMKARLMRRLADTPSDEIEYLLSFGHLHAHAIEENHEYRVAHGLCVVIGLIIDLILGGDNEAAEFIAGNVGRSADTRSVIDILCEKDVQSNLSRYPQGGRFFVKPEHYRVTSISSLGGPADRQARIDPERSIHDLDAIADAINAARAMIAASA